MSHTCNCTSTNSTALHCHDVSMDANARNMRHQIATSEISRMQRSHSGLDSPTTQNSPGSDRSVPEPGTLNQNVGYKSYSTQTTHALKHRPRRARERLHVVSKTYRPGIQSQFASRSNALNCTLAPAEPDATRSLSPIPSQTRRPNQGDRITHRHSTCHASNAMHATISPHLP